MGARGDEVFDTIKATFGSSARIAFEPNGGNLGDVLIAAGTICALDKSGLAWSMLNGRAIDHPSFDVLVYGGGGNLIEAYDGAARFLRGAAAHGKPIVILPHTIRHHLGALKQIKAGMVFCRDLKSLDFLTGKLAVPVIAADDMAFSLDFGMYGLWTVPSFRDAIHVLPRLKRTLYAWRRDGEGQNRPMKLVPPGIDLSSIPRSVGSDKLAILTQTACFLSTIASFDDVWTDRLHIGIAATLLGIETKMVDNNYGKLRDIFEFSIAGRYPNTSYIESFEKIADHGEFS